MIGLFGFVFFLSILLFWSKGRFFVLSATTQRILDGFLILSTAFLGLIALGITGLLVSQTFAFLQKIPLQDFLLSLTWDPPGSATIEPQDLKNFGVIPLITGTLLITTLAMATALPLSLAIAVYLSHFASTSGRGILKSTIEVLAGIPSIVYGFFALYLVSPLLHKTFGYWQIPITSESALTAGLVLGIMVVPYIASLADDALRSVPKALLDQAMALGSTPAEMMIHVRFPAAFPGVLAAILMGFSRAIGETMLVVMAAGLTANLTFNPLQSVTTITVQIVSLMTGDQEFESAKTLSAFALGLVLFLLTLLLNTLTIRVSRWYQEKYGAF